MNSSQIENNSTDYYREKFSIIFWKTENALNSVEVPNFINRLVVNQQTHQYQQSSACTYPRLIFKAISIRCWFFCAAKVVI